MALAALSLRMAYRHVSDSFGRVAMSVVAVALGVALVVAFRLMNAAVVRSFVDTVDVMTGRAALTVTAGEGLTFDEAVVDKAAAVPGVKLAVPLVRSVAFPDDGSGELLTVHGVDLANEAAVRVYHDTERPDEVIDDLLVFLNQPDSVILGREFADRRGLVKGSTIDLVTPAGVKKFTVRGLLEPQGLARTLRGRLVVMDLFAAQRAFTADGQINQIDLLLAEGREVEAVKGAVAAVLPEGLAVEEPALRKAVVRKAVSGFQAMLTAFSLLAVLAGFVVCFSRLGAVFEARTWEVGLLRAVGLGRLAVFVELLKEGVVLGVAGTVMGMGIGVLIAWYGLPFLARTTAIAFRLPVPSAEVALVPGAFAVGAAVGMVAAVIAAAIPAVRLARTQPVAALTMRGREMPAAHPRARWAWPLLLVCVIAGLIAAQQAWSVTALGHVTTVLLALVIGVSAVPLVALAGWLLEAIWRRGFGPAGWVASGHILHQPRRSGLTVATLGIGLGFVLMLGMLGWSFERTLVSQLSSRYRADFVVSSAFVSAGYRAAPLSEAVLRDLASVPGVAVVAGDRGRDVPYKASTLTINAYDAPYFEDRRVSDWQVDRGAVDHTLALVARGEAVMVSSAFAYQNRAKPGDVIELASPNGVVRLKIAAVTRSEPESTVIMNRAVYRRYWNDPLIWLAHVAVDPGSQPARVAAAIARRLGVTYGLRIRSSTEVVDYFAGEARRAFSLQYVLEFITFVLVVVAITDTLASTVAERTREFGMLRAIGVSRAHLFRIVTFEGAAMGILGLLLAVAGGLVLGVFWVKVQFPAILGWKLDLHFPAMFVLGAAVLTVLLCIIGSLPPARKAARLSVPEALRNE